MARACFRNGSEFEELAASVLHECMDRRPVNPSAEVRMPFTFRRDSCKADFRELDADRLEVLLACGCVQRPGYIVNPGVIQFITSGSPNGANEEQKMLQECTREAVPQLSETCRVMPERFDLRSAQAFNVCCKRARVQFDVEKLKCQATVPDDITQLDLSFV
ncbi:hypothetical protein BWQ96_08790 [Gracilariopsis chorda]|uniref:Uncharacterized protein n=1 Tax=Gracilariopsis chorda TaxID=448386 RepID=A0A2V3IHI8_9FLOR|nr:hypothetical protein BWQ96_08790 [Gracilariopsis chorda]|eukprot:PXF41483.1 hypothetical protein BWQ96_08790 [Gracilariopsis chorda]